MIDELSESMTRLKTNVRWVQLEWRPDIDSAMHAYRNSESSQHRPAIRPRELVDRGCLQLERITLRESRGKGY